MEENWGDQEKNEWDPRNEEEKWRQSLEGTFLYCWVLSNRKSKIFSTRVNQLKWLHKTTICSRGNDRKKRRKSKRRYFYQRRRRPSRRKWWRQRIMKGSGRSRTKLRMRTKWRIRLWISRSDLDNSRLKMRRRGECIVSRKTMRGRSIIMKISSHWKNKRSCRWKCLKWS